jgi:hypothetical protein
MRPGEAILLALAFRDQVIDYIQRCYVARKPCTIVQILDAIGAISGTFFDKNTTRMMLKRDGGATPCK